MLYKESMGIIANEIQMLRKDRDLNLTRYGAITLSPFSRKVILKARDKLRQVRGLNILISKPFNYFLALCLDRASDLGEKPNWSVNQKLCKYYNIDSGVDVTENEEVLSASPLLVKKAIDVSVNEKRNPTKRYYKDNERRRGVQFDGTTYTKRGEKYLRPVEDEEWSNSEAMERSDMPPEHWAEEKRKFVELARQGRVSKKGLEYLVFAGLLKEEEVAV